MAAVVTPLLDGEARHHSKREPTKQKAKQEKYQIDLMAACCFAVVSPSKIYGGEGTVEEERTLKEWSKKSSKLETTLMLSYPPISTKC
eukprot:3397879-Ditylum_brightwellii.AAC.1